MNDEFIHFEGKRVGVDGYGRDSSNTLKISSLTLVAMANLHFACLQSKNGAKRPPRYQMKDEIKLFKRYVAVLYFMAKLNFQCVAGNFG